MMPELSLVLERSEVVVGEDTPLFIAYRNASDRVMLLPDPERENPWSQIRVRDLQRQTERSFSPTSVVRKGADAFQMPIPPTPNEVQPGQSFREEGTLLRRVELSGPGAYELTAHFGYGNEHVASRPVKLTVLPLKLRKAEVVGAHSGPGPYHYVLWSHAQGSRSILMLTCAVLNPGEEARVTYSRRMAEIDHPAQPSISVSQNTLSYENHWIVWLTGNVLNGMYARQGRADIKIRPQSAQIASPSLIGPVLLDLTSTDGTRPGRAAIALWAPAVGRWVLAVRSLAADGSVGAGPAFESSAGELRWGRSVMLSDGERRVVVIAGRQDASSLEWVRWKNETVSKGKTVPAARWPGALIGSGMSLNEEDSLLGAAITAAGVKYSRTMAYALRCWRLDAGGRFSEDPAVTLSPGSEAEVDRALVELSPAGRVAALLHTRGGAWLACNGRGECRALPASLSPFGEPVAAFWPDEAEPVLIMAGSDTGITFQRLRLDAGGEDSGR